MIERLAVWLAAAALCGTALAQTGPTTEQTLQLLKKDYVQVEGGRYVHDWLSECLVRLPAAMGGGYSEPITFRTQAEGLRSLLSRDMFVFVSGKLFALLEIGFAKALHPNIDPFEQKQHTLRCTHVEKISGKLDFEIRLMFSEEGIESVMTDHRENLSSTDFVTWEQVLTLPPSDQARD